MEEVDSIIIHFLRQLNIDIDDDIKSIAELTVETIIEAAAKCIFSINKSLKVPMKLPSGISHRIEVAGQIASICKDLGYKNDVGYQTFLYYNETELRQVFMFLIERLPKGDDTKSVTKSDNKSILMKTIGDKIREELNTIWIPPCCNASVQTVGDFSNCHGKFSYDKSAIDDNALIEKLMLMKSKNKPINPTQHTNKFKISETVAPVNLVVKESLKELKEIAIVLRQKLDTLESEKNVMNVEYLQAQKSSERAEAELQNVKSILQSIGINDKEMTGTENLLEKVQQNINKLHSTSEDLTSKNLSLKVQINNIKNSIGLPETEKSKCIKKLTSLKETAKGMKEEYNNKEEIKSQLEKDYERLKKGNKRSVYTKRILEIITNVDKQNMEINKILEDTRQLQKEINILEGQLDRCFSIADETLFRDAKKDDQAKKAYKLLALLHSECNTIVSLVNETGTMARDIIDLEDNIKSEKAKRTEDTLVKIQSDLALMMEENRN